MYASEVAYCTIHYLTDWDAVIVTVILSFIINFPISQPIADTS